jgi:hypothetical protein
MMELLASKRGATKITEQEFVKSYIRSVTMHEMGHILGLRHNFVASRLNTLEDLKDGERVRQRGTVASVMEYDPFNQMALHAPNTSTGTRPSVRMTTGRLSTGIASSPTPARPKRSDRT